MSVTGGSLKGGENGKGGAGSEEQEELGNRKGFRSSETFENTIHAHMH